ncbi:MAG TPA: FAD-binding oxidoreductase [Candidatus Dormibacteraeota bacterium]|jgi:sarcosine oxidase subunit beta|nr:FAD-binding oxidoreductase [Candidatus Dormibacteraeota bacterium]
MWQEDPVWADLLDARERAALNPGPPAMLDRHPDVLVVGGGVQGLSAAAACRERGLGHVLLIERDRLAAGPSGSAAGTLCPEAHLEIEGPVFVAFAQRSHARYRALAERLGAELGLRRIDWVILTGEGAPMPLPEGTPVEDLHEAGLRELLPGLAAGGPAGLVRDGQSHLNPQRLAVCLAKRAGTVVSGVEYQGMEVESGRVRAVHTSHGTVHPGAVVFATGLAPEAMASMPQLLVKGHLCTTEPAPFRLDVSITDRAGGAAVGQLPDGRILTGGDRGEDDGRGVDPAVIASFRERLVRLLPEAAGLEISHAWSCRRPATPDRWPVVDRVPGLDNAWLTAAHYATGILLAPEIAAALAAWIETGRAPGTIGPFRNGAGRARGDPRR